jgi:hypothetical protein
LRINADVGVNAGVGDGSSAGRRSGQRLCDRRWEGMLFRGCRLCNLVRLKAVQFEYSLMRKKRIGNTQLVLIGNFTLRQMYMNKEATQIDVLDLQTLGSFELLKSHT